MTPVLPPYLLIWDISAVMSGRTQDWQDFSRIGDCFVPKAVLEAIDVLCDRAVDSQQEATAREFSRFFPNSGWKAAAAIAEHPALQPTEGHALSSKARLSLTVAQATYALARSHPEALVILVANDQGLLQRLRDLSMPNLCGIPLAAFMQWLRTQRKPPVLAHQLHTMRLASQAPTPATPVPVRTPVSALPSRPIPSPVTVAPVKPVVRRPTQPAVSLSRLRSSFITLLVLTIALLVGWRIVDPTGFGRFLDSLSLPNSQQVR